MKKLPVKILSTLAVAMIFFTPGLRCIFIASHKGAWFFLAGVILMLLGSAAVGFIWWPTESGYYEEKHG